MNIKVEETRPNKVQRYYHFSCTDCKRDLPVLTGFFRVSTFAHSQKAGAERFAALINQLGYAELAIALKDPIMAGLLAKELCVCEVDRAD